MSTLFTIKILLPLIALACMIMAFAVNEHKKTHPVPNERQRRALEGARHIAPKKDYLLK